MASPAMIPAVIDVLKGWPREAPADFIAEYADGETANAGTITHINASGDYVAGLGTAKVMPHVATMPSDSPDVKDSNQSDPSADTRAYVAVIPKGRAGSLVCNGAYEILDKEYAGTADDFPPNTPLTSPSGGGNKGKLTPGTLYSDMVCGFSSRGLVTDNHGGGLALAWWTFPVFPN